MLPAQGLLVTLAIGLHNIPEGLAVATVLVAKGISARRAFWWTLFTAAPQPLVALPSFLFVDSFFQLLPLALGFAAGCMLWMVFAELLPDALNDAKHGKAGPLHHAHWVHLQAATGHVIDALALPAGQADCLLLAAGLSSCSSNGRQACGRHLAQPSQVAMPVQLLVTAAHTGGHGRHLLSGLAGGPAHDAGALRAARRGVLHPGRQPAAWGHPGPVRHAAAGSPPSWPCRHKP